jgi:hypothetical protein
MIVVTVFGVVVFEEANRRTVQKIQGGKPDQGNH